MESRFPIRPQPRLEEVLSGLATIMIIAVGYGIKHPDIAASFWSSEKPLAFVAGLGLSLFIISWIAGTILDTGRDLFEWVIDWFWPLNWDFLMTAPTQDVQRLNGEYFAYYLLNANYVIGGVVILALAKLSIITLQPSALGIIAIITAILFLEAACLRKEIRAIVGTGLPHERIYARLGRSTVDPDGVGVLAIRKISKGTYVFEPDDAATVQINSHRISDLPPELRKLYYDFCPFWKGNYTAPTSLNKLTVAWYVNEPKPSETPNLACDKELRFYALTDIKPGDELTADYIEYCEPPPEEPLQR